MRLFNTTSTALVVDDHLVAAGEHADLEETDRVRALIDAGHLVESDAASEPDEAASPRKRGGSQ